MAESDGNSQVKDEEIRTDCHYWKYKPVTGTVPLARHAFVSFLHSNKFYVIGGYGPGGEYMADSWEYDCETSRWAYYVTRNEVGAPAGWMLPSMHSAAHCLLGDTVYVFGGITQKGQHLGALLRLNVTRATWTTETFAVEPRPRWGATLVSHNGLLYLFGGFGDSFFSDLWRFDPVANTWTELQPLGVPPPRHYHSAVVWNNHMIIIGGYRGSTFTADIWSYEFTNNRWVRLDGQTPLSNRRGHSAIVVPERGTCLVFGGRDDKKRLNDLLEVNLETGAYETLRSAGISAETRVFHASFLFQHSLFIFGGLHIFNTNDILEYVLSPDPSLALRGIRFDFSSPWKSPSISDITFQFPTSSTDGSTGENTTYTTIPAHKVILYAASEHFRTLFDSGMRESQNGVILIEDISPDVFEQVLHFIYTGRCHRITASNVLDLLVAADKYLICELVEQLERALSFILCEENVAHIMALTSKMDSTKGTYRRCIEFVRQHILLSSFSKCIKIIRKSRIVDAASICEDLTSIRAKALEIQRIRQEMRHAATSTSTAPKPS